MAKQRQIRRGTAANRPTLAIGELGLDTDTQILVIGNGSSTPYEAAMTTANQIVSNKLNVEKLPIAVGSGSSYTVTYSGLTVNSLANGMRILFKANIANTGACNLVFNGMSAKSIRLNSGVDPAANTILINSIVEVVYDSSANSFILLNVSIGQRISADLGTQSNTYELGDGTPVNYKSVLFNTGAASKPGIRFNIITSTIEISHNGVDWYVVCRNDGTTLNQFSLGVGTGTDSDKVIFANTTAQNKPALKYNISTHKWTFSNDGITFIDLETIIASLTPLAYNEVNIDNDQLLIYDQSADANKSITVLEFLTALPVNLGNQISLYNYTT